MAFGVSNLRKFWVLTWKTAIVKSRHYIETTLDLLIPTLLFVLMAVLRYQGGSILAPKFKPAEIFRPDFALQQFCNRGFSYDYALEMRNATFLYAPQNEAVKKLMEKVTKANDYFLGKFEAGECPQFVKDEISKKKQKIDDDQMPPLGKLILIFLIWRTKEI